MDVCPQSKDPSRLHRPVDLARRRGSLISVLLRPHQSDRLQGNLGAVVFSWFDLPVRRDVMAGVLGSAFPWTDDERARLAVAGYMEIIADAGGFSCGACRSLDRSSGTGGGRYLSCLHSAVRSPVNPSHGCCNRFYPAVAEPVVAAPGAESDT